MKRNILFISVLIVLFSACGKDFLETTPYTGRDIENFYINPKNALEALVAAYDPIRWNYYNHIILISESASDNCFGGGDIGDDDRLQVWDNFADLYPDPHSDTWRKYYAGIYRVNIFLENVDNVEWGNEVSLKDIYISEARFLRAYYYFDLVRLWGHVPLLTEVLDVDHLNVPQASPDDVYKVIAEDLIFAIEHLPEVLYQQIDPTTYGRVTKWAAESLLGRVFLYYTGYYQKENITVSQGVFSGDPQKTTLTSADVISYLDNVITKSGHNLLPNYASLWVQSDSIFAGEDNIETVFAIKYTYLALGRGTLYQTLGNNWQVMICPKDKGYGTYAGGWGCCPVNPKLWHEWPSEDTRKVASIISWVDEGIIYDARRVKEFGGYNWKKFVPWAVNGKPATRDSLHADPASDNPDDKPEIRFADVLLMSAELNLNNGETEIAQGYFDRVRDRAYQDNLHRLVVTKQAIMDERRWEFAFEGLRYWDLLRQGLDVAKNAIDFNESTPYYDEVIFNKNYAGNKDAIKNIVFRLETKGLFGIPPSQIELSNGYLIQNEGWE